MEVETSGPDPLGAACGPFYTDSDVASRLGIGRNALADAVEAGRILACTTKDGAVVLPAWQFTPDFDPIPGLAETLAVLGSTGDGWRAALWLTAPAEYLPGGVSAAHHLAAGGDPRPVLAAAANDAQRWVS